MSEVRVKVLAMEFCTYCEDYDAETLDPIGPRCGAPAVERSHWKDGRISCACPAHGLAALDANAKELVAKVTRIGKKARALN